MAEISGQSLIGSLGSTALGPEELPHPTRMYRDELNCPKCKLVNSPTAERCDCGFDFKTRTMEHSYLTGNGRHLSKPAIGTAFVLATRDIVRSQPASG